MDHPDDDDDISMKNSLRVLSRLLYRIENSLHPMLFSHVLIRLGHEPQPPQIAHTPLSFVGLSKPVYMYPWIGSYAWNLIRTVGFWNAFTVGLPCSFISSALMTAAEEAAFSAIRCAEEDRIDYSPPNSRSETSNSNIRRPPPLGRNMSIRNAFRSLTQLNSESIQYEENDLADTIDILAAEPSTAVYLLHLMRLLLWRGYGIVISQPFRVVMLRQMAYAVCGGEKQYGWFPQAVRQVYNTNGISGFFQGLVPYVLADLLALSSVISIYRILRLYLFRELDPSLLRVLRSIVWLYHLHYIQEPLHLVGTLLAVRGAGTALPSNPTEVASGSWTVCWDVLGKSDQLLRGSDWFMRRRIPHEVLKAMPEPS